MLFMLLCAATFPRDINVTMFLTSQLRRLLRAISVMLSELRTQQILKFHFWISRSMRYHKAARERFAKLSAAVEHGNSSVFTTC